MAPHSYGEILARNIRAARSRLGIGQDNVAIRMRALGYDAWIRQTVSSTERGRRRPTAEEIFALAYVLQTSIQALMAPTADDKVIDLPSGAALDAGSVYRSTTGMNDGGILWDGDEPNFDAENAPVDLLNRHWQEHVARLQRQLGERG